MDRKGAYALFPGVWASVLWSIAFRINDLFHGHFKLDDRDGCFRIRFRQGGVLGFAVVVRHGDRGVDLRSVGY